jgi:hypothetical protein
VVPVLSGFSKAILFQPFRRGVPSVRATDLKTALGYSFGERAGDGEVRQRQGAIRNAAYDVALLKISKRFTT